LRILLWLLYFIFLANKSLIELFDPHALQYIQFSLWMIFFSIKSLYFRSASSMHATLNNGWKMESSVWVLKWQGKKRKKLRSYNRYKSCTESISSTLNMAQSSKLKHAFCCLWKAFPRHSTYGWTWLKAHLKDGCCIRRLTKRMH